MGLLGGSAILIADQLADAFVIENNRYVAWREKDRDTTAGSQSIGKVHLKSIAAHQFNRKRLEWHSCAQCFDHALKGFSYHAEIIHRIKVPNNDRV